VPEARPDARTRDATFPLFDSLRGLAWLMVFVVHGMYQYAVTRPNVNPGWYRFAIHLDVAVPIFFAISGFLLYRPFVSHRIRGRRMSVRAYGRRRFLRIVPAYWVALAVIVFWFDIKAVKSLGGALYYGGFLQLYQQHTVFHGIAQAWTLCVEVAFYAFLPLWVLFVGWLITRRGRSTIRTELIGVGALILGAWAWQAVTLMLVDVNNITSSATTLVRILPIQLDHLGAGMLLAVLSVAVAEHRRNGTEPPGRRLLRLVEQRPWVLWAGVLAIWLVTCFVGRSGGRSSYSFSDRQFYAEHILYTPLVFLFLLPAVFGDERRDPVRRFLAWRPLAYLGLISYSLYLWHFAIFVQQAKWWGKVPDSTLEWVAWLVPGFVATVVVSSISFFAIEKPFMSLKYRGRRRELEAAHAHAAP
jgi:peptidoglycan/LPS O-acetylase OafA/YrhL